MFNTIKKLKARIASMKTEVKALSDCCDIYANQAYGYQYAINKMMSLGELSEDQRRTIWEYFMEYQNKANER